MVTIATAEEVLKIVGGASLTLARLSPGTRGIGITAAVAEALSLIKLKGETAKRDEKQG